MSDEERQRRDVKCSNCEYNYAVTEDQVYTQFFCVKCQKHAVLIGRDDLLEEVYPAAPLPKAWKQFGWTGWLARNYRVLLAVGVVLLLVWGSDFQCSFRSSRSDQVTDYDEGDYHVRLVYRSPDWVVTPVVYMDGKRLYSVTGYQKSDGLTEIVTFGLKEVEEGKHMIRIIDEENKMTLDRKISILKSKRYLLFVVDQNQKHLEVRMKNQEFDAFKK